MACIELQSLAISLPGLCKTSLSRCLLENYVLLTLSRFGSTYIWELLLLRMKYRKISSKTSDEHLENSLRMAATAIKLKWCIRITKRIVNISLVLWFYCSLWATKCSVGACPGPGCNPWQGAVGQGEAAGQAVLDRGLDVPGLQYFLRYQGHTMNAFYLLSLAAAHQPHWIQTVHRLLCVLDPMTRCLTSCGGYHGFWIPLLCVI